MHQPLEVLSLQLPCDRDAPGVVRRALAEISQLGRRRDDGLLVASELVTNAVLHSGCGVDHSIDVRACVVRDRLMISVHDPGISGDQAAPRSVAEGRAGGWGLRIIDQLARRWGAERPDGYRVWAELALSA